MKLANITKKRLRTIRQTNKKIQSNQKTILGALTEMNKSHQQQKRRKILLWLFNLIVLVLGLLTLGILISVK